MASGSRGSRDSHTSRVSCVSREICLFEGFPALGAENPAARLLVLGSFPSVRSIEKGEYYGHERNYFWPILFSCAGQSIEGKSYADKRILAAELGVVIWDLARSCRRANSSDSELEVLELNDIGAFLEAHPSIARIGLNGGLAAALFLKTLDLDAMRTSGPEPRGAYLRDARHALASIGGVARLRLAGRERGVYRLPSTSPVPTRRFRTMEDKRALWADFYDFGSGQISRTLKKSRDVH